MRGPRENHGAQVPAFGHHPAVLGQLAQPLFHPPAHQGLGRHPGGIPTHRRRPEFPGDFDAVHHQVKSPGIGGHFRAEARQKFFQALGLI